MASLDIDSFPDCVLIGGQRPPGHPSHLPYWCRRTKQLCLDSIPVTDEEVDACNAAIRSMTSSD